MTAPVMKSGQYPLAGDVEYWNDTLSNLVAAGWTDYSSSFTIDGATSDPTAGNSTVQAYYRRAVGSDVVDFTFKYTIGSTFSAGSGLYLFPLPVNMLSPQIWTGPAMIFDSGTAMRVGVIVPNSASQFYVYIDSATNASGSTGPAGAGWATGDYISGTLRYGV